MFKWVVLLFILCVHNVYAVNLKITAERGDRVFISYGGKIQYLRYGIPVDCKFKDAVKDIDNFGNAFDAQGFTCTEDLYIVIKKLADNDQAFIIEVDLRTKKPTQYVASYYRNYDTDNW